MKYKLRMNKNDFYRISNQIDAKNIIVEDKRIVFETSEKSKNKLEKSRYEIEVITSAKQKNKLLLKKSLKYVVSIAFFAAIIYINTFRVSKIVYNEELPINEEISEKINSRMKHLFFFDFINMNYEVFAKELREEYPMYPWINVEKNASTINVYIYKYDDTYQSSGTEAPGHIVAAKDAVIDSYYIYKGVSNIHINQYVKKGDILVSGYTNAETNLTAVAAKAKIMAYTYETVTMEVNKKTTETILSGNSANYYQLEFVSLNYNFNYKALFNNYDKTTKTVFNLFDFLSIKKIEEYEKYDIIKTYNKEEAIDYVKSIIEADFYNNKKVDEEELLNLECIRVVEDHEKYTIQILCRKYESIAEFIKIS